LFPPLLLVPYSIAAGLRRIDAAGWRGMFFLPDRIRGLVYGFIEGFAAARARRIRHV